MSDTQYPDTAEGVLTAARGLVEKGWCKHGLQVGESYCALGALQKAGLGDSFSIEDTPAVSGGWQALASVSTDLGYPCPIDYNNAESTTHQDVLNWFDKAIALAGERGL